jgi:undecaprenyldiphospho-muramoylpentapeptide beta-N-acetylglucosaminyltransferase
MKIVLTGGGTMGHVNPALAVAEQIKTLSPDSELFYITTKKQNEIEAVRARGIECHPISAGKLRRYFSFENLKDAFKVVIGYFQAAKILKKIKPDVVFSKGGYLSVPVVFAAHRLRIRTLTHESDSSLGLATRINARYADKVLLGFPLSLADGKKYIYTGNPVRKSILEAEVKDYGKPLILVIGGSQGARELNELVDHNFDELTSLGFVYHQTGSLWEKHREGENYYQTEFISTEMGTLLKSCRVLITRSGAGALSEGIAAGAPMILVPLSKATRGDQMQNAKNAEAQGIAWVLENEEDFIPLVKKLVTDEDAYRAMKDRLARLGDNDSARKIASLVLDIQE